MQFELTQDKFRDECGVFGIYGHADAARLTYLGLYALQHRGQESCGITASNGAELRLERAMGHVADAFDQSTLDRLPGASAIGHVRYSTAGEVSIREAQPFLVTCQHGQLAVCHNGNLPFVMELKMRSSLTLSCHSASVKFRACFSLPLIVFARPSLPWHEAHCFA